MRVLTWNVWGRHGDWEAREPAIVAVLHAEAPDIVCLQESWADRGGECQAERIAARLGGFQSVVADGPWFNGRWLGNALLSRWPVERHEVRPLPRLDGGPPYRQVVIGYVATPFGEWPVASTHFEHRFDGSAARRLHAEHLLRIGHEIRGDPESSLPLIVGADINAVPDSDEARMLTGRAPGPGGIVFSDVWEQCGGADGATWRADNPYTTDSAWPNRRLDYVLVSWPRPRPVGNPTGAWLAGLDPVDGVHPSDHAAVVAEITTPDAG
jgi:endonuclease/exonuclease/phosphatase family metal-dependent hydrolase